MARPRKNPEALLAEIEHRVANADLLSAEAKAETIAKAKAHVEEQRKKKAIDDLFARAVREEEAGYDPNEEMVTFVPELPEFSPCITIDGMHSYFHGLTYKVPMRVYLTLRDIQFAATCHQREIDGRRRAGDILRAPRYTDLSPQHPAGRVTKTGDMRI
jgi:hypothetical protein